MLYIVAKIYGRMNITSIDFFVFLVIFIGIYFTVAARYQWFVLLIASAYFYWLSSKKASIYILFTIVSVYLCGLWIGQLNKRQREDINKSPTEKKKIRKKYKSIKRVCLAVFIIFNLGILLFAKYYNFIGVNISVLSQNIGGDYSFSAKQLIIPLGISFYTLQAIGYLFDLYRDKMQPESNILHFALMVSFFPQIVQGPFNRYKDLKESLFKTHEFRYNRVAFGMQRMLWGIIKKLVIADRLGLLVNPIFSNYDFYSGTQIFIGSVAYTIQIYADFSGYMDIMCGLCEILDIKMLKNFNRPYFSKSVAEFWRRWHITLGAWFREYMFYPISMSKPANNLSKYARNVFGAKFGKLCSSYIALIFVWICTGLWHGANWTYVAWAMVNVVFILTSMQMEDFYTACRQRLKIREEAMWWKVFQVSRTFLLVCLMRIFSRANDIHTSIAMYSKLFTDFRVRELIQISTYKIGIDLYDIVILALFIVLMFNVSMLQRHTSIRKWIAQRNLIVRYSIYFGACFSAILFAVTTGGGFLYAVF